MTDNNTRILDCLKNIKGSGSFVSSSTAAFIFRGLEVDDLGELSYPINESQAKVLISRAKIILLGHQYTPENFSKDHFKLHDRARAEVLLRAAARAGYYAKMCMVSLMLPDHRLLEDMIMMKQMRVRKWRKYMMNYCL